MDNYKPGYLGKVIPADDPSKLTDFVTNKYDAFSKIYDACKDQSSNISDIKALPSENGSAALSVKVSTDSDTISAIKEVVKDDNTVNVDNNVITAKT